MTIEVDNPYLENLILTGETQPDGSFLMIRGFSLFSFAGGAESYNEVPDKSDVYPIYVSFVQDPANEVPFEVYTDNEYISKSKRDIMADNNEKGLMEKLKALIASFEPADSAPATTDAPADIQKEATPTDEQKNNTPAPTDAPASNKPAPAPATNAEPQKPAPSTQPPKDGEVAKACGDGNKDVSKAAEPAPAGTKMETQTGQPTDAPTVEPLTKDDIPSIVEALCEALGCNEEDDGPEDGAESEEKQYIVKQATGKEDTLVTPKQKSEPIFDMFGRKL